MSFFSVNVIFVQKSPLLGSWLDLGFTRNNIQKIIQDSEQATQFKTKIYKITCLQTTTTIDKDKA